MKNWHMLAIWLLIAVVALVAGCGPRTPPTIPTVAMLPTDTITPSPTLTLTPTITPTLTPSNTVTPSPTITITPSATYTLTPTVTASPTSTNTPSSTPTETPVPTETPTRTPTRTRVPTRTPVPTVMPVINQFSVEPATVISGGIVIVRWSADADTLTLDEMTPQNAVIQTMQVPASGDRTLAVTAVSGNVIIFRLIATKGGNSVVATSSVTVQCPSPWFFAPPPANCPTQPAQSGAFTFQAFERGIAFYVPNTNNVYFLANDGTRVNAYPNEWNPGVAQPTVVAPTGLIDPTAEIGYVWHNKLWSDGRAVAIVIGWALTSPQNYSGTIQLGNPPSDVYIRRPDGAVYKLALAGAGTWSVAGSATQ